MNPNAFGTLNGLQWTPHDLEAKFSQSYVRASIQYGSTEKGDKKEFSGIVYIVAASHGPGSSAFLEPVSETPQKGVSVLWKNFIVEDDRPPPCISNFATHAFLFNYNPERQWKRGVCSSNSFIWKAPTLQCEPSVDHGLALAIFEPRHSSFEEALAAFQKPEITGRALNNSYWLLRRQPKDPIKLYRKRTFLGSFLGKKFFITREAKILTEELLFELPLLKEKYAFK